MKNEDVLKLCLSLLHTDDEESVIAVLEKTGYWSNKKAWRYFGDNENNYSTIGNQQSRPDSALVEKLVNSVDARLMNECLVNGINPEVPNAPNSVRNAVATFFGKDIKPENIAGLIREWPEQMRTSVAKGITLAATGASPKEGNPCFTIADCGEGQTPDEMPNTLLSLHRSNKLRIPFVQGKFNMGGTGALKFCGKHGLQFILTRRNPNILKETHQKESDSQWSFTIIRREDPEGNIKSSVYTYLAPLILNTHQEKGEVLRLSAEKMPLFPEGRDAYSRMAQWGTLIKLYNYSITGHKSHILMKDGLLGRIDLLLPEIALPMRFYECRIAYKGHSGSFETTLTGMGVRLDEDKSENLEEGFPTSSPMNIAGEQMTATIYAFKKGKAGTYRKNEGIIFTLNGQTHGHFTQDLFLRKRVGLSYLADSILLVIDCSKFSGRAREDLFMNSRDRLSNGDFRAEIEQSIEDLLKNHEGLRSLKEKRRREEIESKLDDSKPLEEILENILKSSPTLSNLFLKGLRIQTPFKTVQVQEEEKQFQGERYPTYFKFKEKEYGTPFIRDCHINMKCRVMFETDAVNDYFSREVDPGEFKISIAGHDQQKAIINYTLNLQNGIASLNMALPSACKIGDELQIVSEVTDPSKIEPFNNVLLIKIKEALESKGGGGDRHKPPTDTEGPEREVPAGITMPNIVLINEQEWRNHSPAFNKYSALRIKNAGEPETKNGDSRNIYDFYINVDNVYLKSEMKNSRMDTEIIRAQFKYGLVLLGLGLLQQDSQKKESDPSDDNEEENHEERIEQLVEKVSEAVAPIILPMITSLGSLELNEKKFENAGEAT